MTSLLASPWWTRTTIEISVIDNAAARGCNKTYNLIRGLRFRSETTPYSIREFCGMVITDSGISFRLPNSGTPKFVADRREEIYDLLHAGCSYRVIVNGFGSLEPVSYGAVHPPGRTIVAVLETIHCSDTNDS